MKSLETPARRVAIFQNKPFYKNKIINEKK